jgi:hypothetical protein
MSKSRPNGKWKEKGLVYNSDNEPYFTEVYFDGDDPNYDFTQYDHATWLSKAEREALMVYHRREYRRRSATIMVYDDYFEHIAETYHRAWVRYELGKRYQEQGDSVIKLDTVPPNFFYSKDIQPDDVKGDPIGLMILSRMRLKEKRMFDVADDIRKDLQDMLPKYQITDASNGVEAFFNPYNNPYLARTST